MPKFGSKVCSVSGRTPSTHNAFVCRKVPELAGSALRRVHRFSCGAEVFVRFTRRLGPTRRGRDRRQNEALTHSDM
jgi:hypothetical protein